MLVITRNVTIDRPVGEVEQQFGDVAHHERTAVHHGVQFAVLDETPEFCVYEQVTKLGPARIRQSFRLERNDPACQVNTITGGAFSGGSITFEITPIEGEGGGGERATAVTATLRAPVRGIAAWFAPVLRRALGRSLARALGEDRRDLESGKYTGRASQSPHTPRVASAGDGGDPR